MYADAYALFEQAISYDEAKDEVIWHLLLMIYQN